MRLSREKVNYLSQIVVKDLKACPAVNFLKEDNDARLKIVKIITDELRIDDEIDVAVRRTLASYTTRRIEEGSREWDVMYQKLYEEEMNRRRRY